MTRNPTPEQTLQRLPKKWAVAIVAALIAYALVQPFVNSRFGWHLPSLASALGMEKSASDKLDSDSSKVTGRPTSAREVNGDGSHAETSKPETRESEEAGDANPSSTSETSLTSVTAPPGSQTETQKTGDEKSSAKQSSETGNSASKVADAKRSKPDSTSNLLYGLLKDTGREVYVSPAGLRYTRGSEEGHRLKHIEKHLKDIPTALENTGCLTETWLRCFAGSTKLSLEANKVQRASENAKKMAARFTKSRSPNQLVTLAGGMVNETETRKPNACVWL